jgi:predicted acetyltransferase
MDRQLDEVQERGEPLAILFASESNIYGRFGYGPATFRAAISVERDRAAFARPLKVAGSFSLLDAAEAAAILPAVYERFRALQPAAVNRSAAWWDLHLRDVAAWRGEGSSRFYVLYRDTAGAPAGYVAYRVKQEWREGIPGHTLSVQDFFALDDAAHAALWHYLLTMDLVGTVKAWNRPVDEPLRWLLAEPRRLRVDSINDGLWVRLVDVPAALTARRYAVPGALVLAVCDAFRPTNDGCYALEGGPDGADCRRTSAEPDLTLEAGDLGAAYLGGVPLSNLARAGRVVEHTPGALARADALFACTPAPWSTTMF